jgi:AAA+ ATPase superfamily predicted ATPase
VVVIDEFPNLMAEDKAVLSTLQAIVDQMLSGTNMKLVLVGSSVSVMTSRVVSYKSPPLRPEDAGHAREAGAFP